MRRFAPFSNPSLAAFLCTWIAFGFLALSPILAGDWIQLRSGVQVHGKILRRTPKEIVLSLEKGGVSSFAMKDVLEVHQSIPDRRASLPLGNNPRAGDEANGEAEFPPGLHPRPDALRSVRRPVPGGSLLLPEEAKAVRDPEEAAETGSPVSQRYRLEESRAEVSVTLQPIPPPDESRRMEPIVDRLRRELSGRPGVRLHHLEATRISDRHAWTAEWSVSSVDPEGRESPARRVLRSWIMDPSGQLRAITVEILEQDFLAHPYRFRVIPRSFRAEKSSTPYGGRGY